VANVVAGESGGGLRTSTKTNARAGFPYGRPLPTLQPRINPPKAAGKKRK